MSVIDCLALAEKKRQEYGLSGRACLHIIQIGENPVNDLYLRSKQREAEKWNVEVVVDRFTGEENLIDIQHFIFALNRNDSVDGIIIQLPTCLKKEYEDTLLRAITQEKDVDGLGEHSRYTPCTPKGIMWLLEDIGYKGKVIAVIGRGKLVGKPLIDILRTKPCTLICMNSHTNKYQKHDLLTYADIIVTATGKAKSLHANNTGCAVYVIDAGISRVEGKQVGDFDVDSMNEADREWTDWTPWINGIGKLTVAALMANVREAHKRKHSQ